MLCRKRRRKFEISQRCMSPVYRAICRKNMVEKLLKIMQFTTALSVSTAFLEQLGISLKINKFRKLFVNQIIYQILFDDF